jgi:hypothetical protein
MKTRVNLDLYIILVYIIGYVMYRDKNKCLLFLNNKLCVYDMFLILLVSIFMLGFYYHHYSIKEDPLTIIMVDGVDECDYWALLHFIVYAGMGFMFPDKYLFFLTAGIAWEVFEHYNGLYDLYFFGLTFNRGTANDDRWWYGRMIDVVANTTGYTLGSYIHNGLLTNKSVILNEFVF